MGQIPMGNILVLLNDGERTSIVNADGTFQIKNLPPAKYSLEVVAPGWSFNLIKLDVATKQPDKIQALEYNKETGQKRPLSYPLMISPVGKIIPFEKRETVSIASMLSNPMVIMVIVSVGIVMMSKNVMKDVDMEAFQKAQEEMGTDDPMSMIQNIFGMGEQEPAPTRETREVRRRRHRE